jgi:putative redox protein
MSTLSLDWTGDLNFTASAGSPPIELHSSTPGMVSPTQALAYATMACMAMDVVHVLSKGRHEFSALSVKCESARADKPPRRYTAMHLHFDITGTVAPNVVERAIELSRTTYCSVWNSLRTDIDFKTTFTIQPAQAF